MQNQINGLLVNQTDESSRIVGGTTTTVDKAKFIVNLRVKGKFICGGSLITPKYVVTAAHCLDGVTTSELTIVGGATYLTDKGITRNVKKMFVPKEYNSRDMHMDIAVLALTSSMTGHNISTIQLCKSVWKTNDIVTVYGWGQIAEHIDKISNQLRVVQVPIIGHAKCSELYKGRSKLTPSMFCAGDLKRKDACAGDSGGPAIFQNQLCGVVSWGIGCAQSKYPGVYTNIMYVKNFIDKIIN